MAPCSAEKANDTLCDNKKDAVAKLPLHLLIFPHFADKIPPLGEDFAPSFSQKNLEGGASN